MKLKNMVLLGAGAAVGYVLGSRAGRARFEQIKSRANEFVHSPTVQDGVANVATRVRDSADKLPGPAAGIVRGAADHVHSSVDHQSEPPAPGPTV